MKTKEIFDSFNFRMMIILASSCLLSLGTWIISVICNIQFHESFFTVSIIFFFLALSFGLMEIFSIDLFPKENKIQNGTEGKCVHIFKKIYFHEDGEIIYYQAVEIKNGNESLIASNSELMSVVANLFFVYDQSSFQMNIDFKPIHEFIYSGTDAGNPVPCKFLPLTEQEKEYFFSYVKKMLITKK